MKKRNQIDRFVGLGILVGVILKLAESPYGNLVFTVSFSLFLLLKLVRLFRMNIRLWTVWHYLNLMLILIAWAALIFRYFDYPYSFAVFAVALLAELLVSVKIKVNRYVSDGNLREAFRSLVRARKGV